MLVVGALHLALPDALSAGPPWLLLVIVAALLAPTVIAHRLRLRRANEWLGHVLGAVQTLALVYAIGALVRSLLHHDPRLDAATILRAAAVLWATTVLVFATWYWRLDAGGPNGRDVRRRAGEAHTRGAFLFPQMTIVNRAGFGGGSVS